MKKKLISVITILLLVSGSYGALYAYNFNSGADDVITATAKHEDFGNLNELESSSDIIIVGKKIKGENVIEKFDITEGDPDSVKRFHTLADFKINEVLKNENNNPSINKNTIVTVVENSAYEIDALGNKKVYHIDGYGLMKENKKYVLYLRKSESTEGEYIIRGVIYGKVPLENSSTEINSKNTLDEGIKNAEKIIKAAKDKYKNK
jgi:hypothetical protein